jgi:hypothetical protein
VPGRVVRDLSAEEIDENEDRARRYVERADRHRETRWREASRE